MLVSFYKKTRITFLVIFFAILISVSLSSYKYLVKGDYVLYVQQSCDPSLEECLVKDCDSEEDPRCHYT